MINLSSLTNSYADGGLVHQINIFKFIGVQGLQITLFEKLIFTN